MIGQDELKALLSYSPETGVFTWIAEKRSGLPKSRIAGTLRPKGYVTICVAGKVYSAHRLAWLYMTGAFPLDQIDHINGKKNDNSWRNLRDVSGSVNQQNRNTPMATNSARMLGAFRSGKLFCSKIRIDGEQKYLGTFKTAEAAHQAYLRAKAQYHEGYAPC